MGQSKSKGDTARTDSLNKSAAGRAYPPVFNFRAHDGCVLSPQPDTFCQALLV